MSRIIFLGVWMTPDVGETVSFVLENDDRILIDCGTNLVGSLVRNQLDPSDITHIILTHSHGDHLSGLPTYLFYRFLIAPNIMGKLSPPLKIIGTKNTLDAAKEYVRIVYGSLADNPGISYEVVNIDGAYKTERNAFTFFPSKHSPETIGFVTEIKGKKIVYSGDTALCDDVMKHAEHADVLIHDVVGTSKYKPLSSAHTLCSEISPELEKHTIKNFYPVHRLSIYKYGIGEYLSEIKSAFSGNVTIPNDGDVINL